MQDYPILRLSILLMKMVSSSDMLFTMIMMKTALKSVGSYIQNIGGKGMPHILQSC